MARDPIVVRYARVVGGFETAAGAFPWTAAVRNKAVGFPLRKKKLMLEGGMIG